MIPVEHLEVAVLDRTRTQPRKFVRLVGARLVALLGERGPVTPDAPAPEDATAPKPAQEPAPDDPADPTDQVSGQTPPLENPVTGEPPVAPPIAPPGRPAAPKPEPTDPVQPPPPAQPGETPP